TYGKGTVQTLFSLQSTDAGLRLTTAKFYSPEGREMAGAGVQPDVPVDTSASRRQGDPRSDAALETAVNVAQRLRSAPPGRDFANGARRRSFMRHDVPDAYSW